MDSLRLYFKYLGISIRGQMQYRASFIIQSLGHFMVTGIEFLGMVALFQRFGRIDGWTLPEVALFYGLVNVAFALSEAIPRGFDLFDRMVRTGEFDRILLRPRTTVLQLMGQELDLKRIGRLTQGLAVLGWAIWALETDLTLARILLIFGTIVGGFFLFSGLFVLQATLCFWTVQSIEIVNTMTYGGVETAQYPLTIYKPWFRRFFIFVVPLACVNYLPALAIMGRPDPLGSPVIVQWLAPLLGPVFFFVSIQIWKIGVRHYCSTGV